MTYYLVAYSAYGNYFKHAFDSLWDIVKYYNLDRYKDFVDAFKDATTEDQKIEVIIMELENYQMPFSPEDDSTTYFKIFKDPLKAQDFCDKLVYEKERMRPRW